MVEANSGRRALDLARNRPDVIVLDVGLPDLDGFEVYRRLRQGPETANIPVVYVTSTHSGHEEARLALDLGAVAYLRAPIEPATLVSVVQSALQAPRSGQASRRGDLTVVERLISVMIERGPLCEECLSSHARVSPRETASRLGEIREHVRIVISNGICIGCQQRRPRLKLR